MVTYYTLQQMQYQTTPSRRYQLSVIRFSEIRGLFLLNNQ